jgi:hypothetical protein
VRYFLRLSCRLDHRDCLVRRSRLPLPLDSSQALRSILYKYETAISRVHPQSSCCTHQAHAGEQRQVLGLIALVFMRYNAKYNPKPLVVAWGYQRFGAVRMGILGNSRLESLKTNRLAFDQLNGIHALVKQMAELHRHCRSFHVMEYGGAIFNRIQITGLNHRLARWGDARLVQADHRGIRAGDRDIVIALVCMVITWQVEVEA